MTEQNQQPEKKRPQRTVVTQEQIIAAVEADDNMGFCLACGAEAFGVEPDACNYECEVCGAERVFGAEELLLGGGSE